MTSPCIHARPDKYNGIWWCRLWGWGSFECNSATCPDREDEDSHGQA